jgi:hypothetical protein
VFGHLAVGTVEARVVEIRLDDAALEIVQDNTFGNTAEELKHAHMRGDETRLILFEG